MEHLNVFILMSVWLSRILCGLSNINTRAHYANEYIGGETADGDEFDYIVVGAGAAGSAVAARLTLAGLDVLLVEAGGDAPVLTQIPGATFVFSGSPIDWDYDTITNNKSCLGYKRRRCRWTRGRCLGGSTSLNYMLYTRGNREDFNFNITGWTWKDIEPYFLRYEGLRDVYRLPKSSKPYHNTSGFVSIGYFGESGNLWHDRLIEGFISLNFPYNPDVNAKSQIGVSQVLGFTSRGERVSTAKAYLDRKKIRKKLKIAKHTHCTKIIIDKNNIARGVIVSRGLNDTQRLFVKHEIVLSAGTIGSAQLLMLSGVGPLNHLKLFGIPIKADLQVGTDMIDHVLSLLLIKVDYDARPFFNLQSVRYKTAQAIQWLVHRSGPLASIGLTDVTAFVNTKCYNYTLRRLIHNQPECEIPTLQIIFSYMDKGIFELARPIIKRNVHFGDNIWDQISNANKDNAYIVVSAVVLHPESRGYIRLASRDPFSPPVIKPNYLDDERDIQEILRGLRIIEHLVESPHFKRYKASTHKIHFPECPEVDSDKYWECYARHMTHSVQHAMGTAALGRVVDERLRVLGVGNLRVGDASVFPRLPRGNTAAAVIAVGERLSDFLIQDRRM